MTNNLPNITNLLNLITKQDGTNQPIEGAGDRLISYLVDSHYDCDWEGWPDVEKLAFEELAADIIRYFENQ